MPGPKTRRISLYFPTPRACRLVLPSKSCHVRVLIKMRQGQQSVTYDEVLITPQNGESDIYGEYNRLENRVV